MMAPLERLKLRLGIKGTEEDALLQLLLDDAMDYAVNYCNLGSRDDIPEKLYGTIVDMAVISYNKTGSEGLSSESYAGASYNYDADLPEGILTALQRERLAVLV
ncbi:MAG: head-tail connector protein [bacterium]|nr:head-tail connector protein [bacterium]